MAGSILNRAKGLRRVLLVLGAGCMLLAVGVDWFGLSNPATFGKGQVLLVLLGGGLMLLGWLGRRVVGLYRDTAVVVLNTIVLVVILECGAYGLVWLGDFRPAPPAPPDPRITWPYYADQAWSAQYWKEFDQSDTRRYVPYLVWQRRPFEGETIVIDQNSVRHTPGANCDADSYVVLVLGGSTVWGSGAPDWGTIPAYLQAGLTPPRPGPVCVVNLGESAYVSAQEVIRLMSWLESDGPPDLALFLHGVNDVFAAYQSGRAGVHQNLQQVSARFDPTTATRTSPLADWLRSFQLYSLFATRSAPETARLSTYRTIGVDTAVLGGEVIDAYADHLRIAEALADDYGFEVLFFLQPVITEGEKPLTEAERRIEADLDAALIDLLNDVYTRADALAEAIPGFHDLRSVFDGESSDIWIDFVHVTPEGNRLIADEIFRQIQSEGVSGLASRPGATETGGDRF